MAAPELIFVLIDSNVSEGTMVIDIVFVPTVKFIVSDIFNIAVGSVIGDPCPGNVDAISVAAASVVTFEMVCAPGNAWTPCPTDAVTAAGLLEATL